MPTSEFKFLDLNWALRTDTSEQKESRSTNNTMVTRSEVCTRGGDVDENTTLRDPLYLYRCKCIGQEEVHRQDKKINSRALEAATRRDRVSWTGCGTRSIMESRFSLLCPHGRARGGRRPTRSATGSDSARRVATA